MGIFKSQRLPQGDLQLSYGGIAFVVHVWAFINILAILPVWVLRTSIWELAGAISYPLVEALLESSILWIGFVALSYLLPKKWLAVKFAVLSSALAWLLCLWVIFFHYQYERILEWGSTQILLGVLLVIFSFEGLHWLIQRYERFEKILKRLVRAIAILTYCYVLFDLLGLVVIVVRNI